MRVWESSEACFGVFLEETSVDAPQFRLQTVGGMPAVGWRRVASCRRLLCQLLLRFFLGVFAWCREQQLSGGRRKCGGAVEGSRAQHSVAAVCRQ